MQEKEQKISPIKDRILHFAGSLGISKREFYSKIQVSRGTLESKTGITEDVLAKFIATYPDVSLNWLLTGEGNMLKETMPVAINQTFPLRTDRQVEIQDIPLYDISATAGILAIFNDNHINPEDYLRVPNLPPVDGAIYVRGESMVPLLKSGDIIIYKKLACSLDSILWGQIYLLSFSAGGETFTVVKYLQKSDQPGYIRLVSQNDRFQPKDIPLDSIHALAIVKASIAFHTIE